MPRDLETLDQYVRETMESWHVPGVALAVIKGNEVLHMAGYGVRDVETGEPVTPDTLFAIASITKSFTAMGIALQVDEGTLEWDAPVRDYLPYFKLQDGYVSEKITVRDLLCHRSGLPRHDFAWYGTDFDRDTLVKNLQHLAFSKGFREAWQYQNLMYMTAGFLSGEVDGTTWEDVIQRRIFDALDMKRSCFTAEDALQRKNCATPYRIRRRPGESDRLEPMPHYTDATLGPAGSIYSTAAELANWLQVHLSEGTFDGRPFVSPGNLKQMHLPQMIMPLDATLSAMLNTEIFLYTMGWFMVPYRGYTLIHHGGNIDGFSLITGFVPQEKIGVVALTNIESRPLRDVLLFEICDRLLDLPDNNWNARYQARHDAMYAAIDQDTETAEAERMTDRPPTHPLDAYTGEYQADGYPDFKVRLDGNTLQGWIVGEWFDLKHLHYDIFSLDLARFETRLPISFLIDTNGAISAVSVPIETNVANVVFTRKPLAVDTDELAALAGVYDMPFEGMDLTITVKQGRAYSALTGQAEAELVPYRLTETSVEFQLKKDDRVRVELVKDAQGGYHAAILKEPGMVFNAPRK
ncbi:MAG: serine hydrolase [Anaerolineae bacterium]|nr:serine hydrolase [Anaerolineae bacterium]